MIYFDNAATTYPKPPTVARAMYDATINYGGNPGRSGHKMSVKASKMIYNLREKLSDMFGASPECVVFTKNCTEALNIAITSIMKYGGNAIISSFEHNSVLRPLENLKNNKVCDFFVNQQHLYSAENLIIELNRLYNQETKMIIFTHASNVNGTIAPIAEIASFCKQKNIIFCLDASQSAGILDINITRDDIDILCLPGHKALFGPTGIGVLITKNNINLSPIIYGGTGSISLSPNMPDFLPDKLESGTLNVVGCAGLSAGLDFVNHIGIDTIYAHELCLIQKLYDNLANNSKIVLYQPYPTKNHAVATLSFNVKGKACTDISEYLNANNYAIRSGYHCSLLAHSILGTSETGTNRVSLSIFNNFNQINTFSRLLEKINI